MRDALVLGRGYVGNYFKTLFPQSYATRRTADAGDIHFDVESPHTWKNIPDVKNVLWTFPAATDAVQSSMTMRFFEDCLAGRNVIVLGTTSVYSQHLKDEWLDEKASAWGVRAETEEELRQQGATILRLAGIFGPQRNPLDWIKDGLIKSGQKYVNLVHVEDICNVAQLLLEKPQPEEVFNLSNGEPQTWNNILAFGKANGAIPKDFELAHEPDVTSKRLKFDKIKKLLPASYQFKSFLI